VGHHGNSGSQYKDLKGLGMQSFFSPRFAWRVGVCKDIRQYGFG
jgi:hypothetical protein